MGKKSKKFLKWVYPPNNWKTPYNKTFVYGSSDPKAKLFVLSDEYLVPEKIRIFPNGNFAKSIKLPNIENKIKLIQVLGNKKKIITRKIVIARERKQPKQSRMVVDHDFYASRDVPPGRLSIVIDPGHGGKEHGTHSPTGIPEKHFNLQIARSLVKALCTTPLRAKIYLTRSKDKFVSLKQRVDFARKKKANLLISIHHNALPDNADPIKHSGIGVYYAYDSIKPFARKILESICKETKIRAYGIFKRDFALTKPALCKAVLIECGFLTHPLEAECITQKRTQEKIVRGIVKAIF